MITRQQIVDEARTWLGTNFLHQGSLKGLGVDCVNFIAEVAKATGAVPDIEFEKNYRREENGETMARLFNQYLDPISWMDAQPADVLVISYKGIPRHCMIVTEREDDEFRVIEASREQVTEHRVDESTKRRIHSAFRVREIQ